MIPKGKSLLQGYLIPKGKSLSRLYVTKGESTNPGYMLPKGKSLSRLSDAEAESTYPGYMLPKGKGKSLSRLSDTTEGENHLPPIRYPMGKVYPTYQIPKGMPYCRDIWYQRVCPVPGLPDNKREITIPAIGCQRGMGKVYPGYMIPIPAIW